MLLPLLSFGTAAAASPTSLAYYYDPHNLSAMKTAAGKTTPDDNGFSGSYVLAKGGFFDPGTKFTYAREVSQNYQYIDDYYCVNGTPQAQAPTSTTSGYYQVEISANLILDNNFDSRSSYPQSGGNNSYNTSITHVTQYDSSGSKVQGVADSNGLNSGSAGGGSTLVGQQGSGQSITFKSSCLTPYNQLSGAGSMINYQKASATVKATWKSALNGTASAQVGGNPGGTPSGSGTPPLSCDGSLTSSLSWFLCPVIDLMTHAVDVIDGWITSQLDINTNQIFCTTSNCKQSDQNTSNDYYNAWSSFRNIALGIMVIAGLIIVIAQALGMEILDAYTLRKALPRLLIAAIGITLSWPLMSFMVNLSNDLGIGIRHLIYVPFSGLKDQVGLGFGGGVDGGVENFVTGLIGSAVALGATIAMLPIIFSLLGTATLAVLIALVVLLLRQVAIILLILVAPVAIVLYILPNTQKAYQIWWDSFSKALLMFPLIAGFIAAGRVFSSVALASPDVLHQIIGFAAYFAPYFLIPVTFRLAGGAIRQIGGFVNDRSRGGFDRLRQGRANSMKQIGQDIYSGQATRFLGAAREGSFRDRYNKGLQKAAHVGSAGLRPSQWKENIAQSVAGRDVRGTSKELQNDEAFGGIRGNDLLAEALASNDFDVEKARTSLTKDVGKVKADQMISGYTVAGRALRKKGFSERAIQTATVLSGATASTAYTREEDYEPVYDASGKRKYDADGKPIKGAYIGSANLAANLARLSGGDANLQAQMTAGAMEATTDRPELMPSFTEGFQAMQDISNASSHGNVTDRNGNVVSVRDEQIKQSAKTLRRTAIRKKGINVLFANGHTSRHMAKEYENIINEKYAQHVQAQQSGTPAQKAKAEDEWQQMVAEMVATQNNASNLPLEKRVVVGNLIAHPLDPGVTVQSEANKYRTNEEFQKYVSDFSYLQKQNYENMTPAERVAAEAARGQAQGGASRPIDPPGQ
jgi:hypothetical protein